MLETARVFIANSEITLAAPIIFLFNGAEETLSQAAHGFMAHDRYTATQLTFCLTIHTLHSFLTIKHAICCHGMLKISIFREVSACHARCACSST